MCGPVLMWNLFTLDISFVLLVVGAGAIFRARGSPPAVWVSFGMLAASVGAFLFYMTYAAQNASAATTDAVAALQSSC